jgi:hypothetical protein
MDGLTEAMIHPLPLKTLKVDKMQMCLYLHPNPAVSIFQLFPCLPTGTILFTTLCFFFSPQYVHYIFVAGVCVFSFFVGQGG